VGDDGEASMVKRLMWLVGWWKRKRKIKGGEISEGGEEALEESGRERGREKADRSVSS